MEAGVREDWFMLLIRNSCIAICLYVLKLGDFSFSGLTYTRDFVYLFFMLEDIVFGLFWL